MAQAQVLFLFWKTFHGLNHNIFARDRDISLDVKQVKRLICLKDCLLFQVIKVSLTEYVISLTVLV